MRSPGTVPGCILTFGRGSGFPHVELADHAVGNRRRLSELIGGDPGLVNFVRGYWCPEDSRFFGF